MMTKEVGQEGTTKTVLSEKDLSTILDIQPASDWLADTMPVQIVTNARTDLVGSYRLNAVDQLDAAKWDARILNIFLGGRIGDIEIVTDDDRLGICIAWTLGLA